MKNSILFILIFFVAIGCNHREKLADAYGNFEVEAIIVSAETTGKLLVFDVQEGMQLNTQTIIGLIDTTSITIQLNQLDAQIAAVKSKITNVNAQINAQKQQKKNMQVNAVRIEKLLKNGVATEQQKDDLDGQLKLVDKQIEASKTQIVSINKEIEVLKEQKNLVKYQLSKCKISSPISGVVLEKYVNEGEMAIAGKPLMKIASLTSLDFRCYIAGDMLTSIQLGETVSVFVDAENNTMKEMKGTVSWISQEAEFTPKIIQTKEERVKLVYAVKIKVPNDGSLKIGMPAELRISQ
ncbi:MAG: HlyD family efflux transporter periplasmic adaptor subunit [Prolixibacteraceae bacterium]|jgi:HlyD family secretion protein|nr:HlyD family efflux transporter periplasmic adaptor subunit [Prolixibacteraceae bacterium]